jgi:uncharacterized membrane protein
VSPRPGRGPRGEGTDETRRGPETGDPDFWRAVDRPRRPGRREPASDGEGGVFRRSVAESRSLAATSAGRVLIAVVGLIAVATCIGLLLLWPSGSGTPTTNVLGETSTATVARVGDGSCGAGPACRRIAVDVDGRSTTITIGPVATAPDLEPGDRVRIARTAPATGLPAGGEAYTFVDVARGRPLLLLLVGLAVLAVALLRWRGLLAFAGLGLSVLVAATFVVPAVLAGSHPLLVALVASSAVMFVTLVLTHGVGVQTLTAAVGITATLLLACALALASVGVVHLTGYTDDAALVLHERDADLSLQGVVVAGIVIGCLGVLADTAVTQASAVMALRRARPSSSAAELRAGATAVGRDHLNATIHTLVLAYVGASLPLLLAMRATGLRFADAINGEAIAEPVVAAIVGCAALLLAVPVTTGLTAAFAVRLPTAAIPDGHGHAH